MGPADTAERQPKGWKNGKLETVTRNSFLSEFSTGLNSCPTQRCVERWSLPWEVINKIDRVSKGSDLAVYILLVTLFKGVALRYTGDTLSTVISPLYRPGDSNTDARFVVLQDQLLSSTTLAVAMEETRRTIVYAYSHTECSLADVFQNEMAQEVLRNHPLCVLEGLHAVETIPAWVMFALKFYREEQGLGCEAVYDAARLRSDLVKQFCVNFSQFMGDAITDFGRAIKSIELVPSALVSSLADFSQGPSVCTPTSKLHELFEEQVARTPEATALIFRHNCATYQELNAMSDRAAARLMALGVKPRDFVVLSVTPGLEMVAAMIAVLKAGAAFVPMRPDEPHHRLLKMLSRCRLKLIVTHEEHSKQEFGVKCVTLSSLTQPDSSDTWVVSRADPGPDAPAYIIFTSGSTGEPKGVVIEHRGIVNAISWKRREYELAHGDITLSMFNYIFDGFILNLFAPLSAGAQVVLLDDDELRQPGLVAAYIAQRGITHLTTAPILYRALLSEIRPNSMRSLKQVTLAGESADQATLDHSQKVAPSVIVSNEYGPTENSVVSTFYRCLSPATVNVIGQPIDNVEVWILDAEHNVLPPGITGEIFLGGRGLAKGIVGEANLWEDSLIQRDGKTLYRTGDFGRWLSSGDIEFRGRQDRYLKLLGRRVDLEEIRTCILQHHIVKDVALVAADAEGEAGLTACVVLLRPISLETLVSKLQEQLPAYMVPSRFVPFSELPLTEGGKLDVAALRTKLDQVKTAEVKVPPTSQIEFKLIEIWRRLLGVDVVGVDQNFFSVGGHSLNAVRLLSEIHREFGVDLPFRQIFVSNTVRAIAEKIAESRGELYGRATSANDDAGSTLSSAQERLVTLAQSQGATKNYNLPLLFWWQGNIDVPRLERAIASLTRRHKSLRTCFRESDGHWKQIVSDASVVRIIEPHVLIDADLAPQLESALAPFDLDQSPLFRVVLFTFSTKNQGYLLFDFHHSIVDEASLELLFGDLSALYNGEQLAAPPALEYVDYARAERASRTTPEYALSLAYWASRLSGTRDIEPINLPYDRPHPAKRQFTGDVVQISVPREVGGTLKELCRSSEVTDFMLFAAAVTVFLSKYSHQSTIIVGAPVSVRTTQNTREVVGLFLNTIPLLNFVHGETSFRQFLKSAKARITQDLFNSHVQFDDIVAAARIRRQFQVNPLFEVMVSVVSSSATQLALDGALLEKRHIHNGTSKFDLTFEVDASRDDILVSLEFSTERFSPCTVREMLKNFVELLRNIASSPDAPIADLSILPEPERARLIEWGKSQECHEHGSATLAALFERIVEERGAAVALVAGNERITYRELNSRANRLARRIGFVEGGNMVIGVLCGRSPSAIVSILAVQKAGAAHLPLDPAYPIDQTRRMLVNSGARVLVTDQANLRGLATSITVIHLDREDFSTFDDTNIDRQCVADQLAYVLYTSGTTGEPKGVMIEQKNVVSLVQNVGRHFGINHHDVMTLFHSMCFDVSVWEMFGALLHGATLVIVPEDMVVDPSGLLRLIRKHGVTVLCQPPSAFYLLAHEMVRTHVSTSLRCVVLGGEPIKIEQLKKWCARYGNDPSTRLVNGYGISETTVYSTFKDISTDELQQPTCSIGEPLNGTYIHILDPEGGLCPIGVTGEIYIGGLGVGRGYLGRPDLTRARYVSDPVDRRRRVYRSGDLARWLPNGEIEFLGRTDTQVKVRGYRVEISGVESVFSEHPSVREVVVVAHASPGINNTQLFAYFTADVHVNTRELLSYMRQRVPSFMVPARIIQVDRIPLTPNGKIDQRKLLGFDSLPISQPKRSDDSLERLVVKCWSDVLGIPPEQIGADESFFDIGGDSLSVVFVARILSSRGLGVGISDIFENSTVRQLCTAIRSKRREEPRGIGDLAEPEAYWSEPWPSNAETSETSAVRALSREVNEATFNISIDDFRTADLQDGDGIAILAVLLTAVGMALRMWTGRGSYRVLLVEETCVGAPSEGDAFLSAVPLVLTIRDINRPLENVMKTTEELRKRAGNKYSFEEWIEQPTHSSTLTDSVVLFYVDTRQSSVEQRRQRYSEDALDRLWGVMTVVGLVTEGSVELKVLASQANVSGDRLEALIENLKFAVGQINRSVVPTATRVFNKEVDLGVQPCNELYYKDCTSHALLTAFRHFGGDIRLLVANCTSICEIADGEISRGLRVRNRYIGVKEDDDVLRENGIEVRRFCDSADLCSNLVAYLSSGQLVIIQLDGFFIKGKRDLYQKKHLGHSVLVCGYDQPRKIFNIVDSENSQSVRYRVVPISFEELARAYTGYNSMFNSYRIEPTLLIVGAQSRTKTRRWDDVSLRHMALATLEQYLVERSEARYAWARLPEEFSAMAINEDEFMQNIAQVNYSLGNLLCAKQLEAFNASQIIRGPALTPLVNGMVSKLAYVRNVLTKMQISGRVQSSSLRIAQMKLEEVSRLESEVVEAITQMVHG